MLNTKTREEQAAYRLLENLTDLPPNGEMLAQVAWNLLCEPGDSTAGKLIDSLGAEPALNSLINRESVARLALQVQEQGNAFDELNIGEIEKLISDGLERWLPRLSFATLLESLEILSRVNTRIIFDHEHRWPSGMQDLGFHRPRMLWYRGSLDAIASAEHSVSVVGARASTSYGEKITQDLTAAIVEAGATVVSGGAYGIDAIAHRTALAMGGKTIAVMAGGLDSLYPRANHQLLSRIISEGAVVAEVPARVHPSKWRFLQRNRLIAAMSQTTLVVEAGFKSGARNTANRAATLNRRVFAVPGPISSPASQGCNMMIAERVAELVQSSNDFLEISGLKELGHGNQALTLGALETRALDAIGFEQLTAPEIALSAGLTSSETDFALSALQLFGLVSYQRSRWRAVFQTKV